MLDRSSTALSPPSAPDGAPQGDTLRQRIASRLHRDVVACRLPPGAVYSEADLARRYGVGKAPIRAALLGEEATGFATAASRAGWRIVPLTTRLIGEVYAVRRAVEPLIAASDPARLDAVRLDAALTTSRALLGVTDPSATATAWQADREILELLAAATGNAQLTAILRRLWDHAARASTMAALAGVPIATAARDPLVDAIRSGCRSAAEAEIDQELARQLDRLTAAVMRSDIPIASAAASDRTVGAVAEAGAFGAANRLETRQGEGQ